MFDWIKNNKDIPILNNGQNLYQFIHINDLNEAIYRSSLISGSNIFNIGAEKFGSMHQTINSVIKYVKSNSKIRTRRVKIP